jgi:beta-lactamase regulating signal transducer with metallopeptidase domain
MIAYIIKSGLCLALLLVVYKVLLERERMYVFNRYYLLFGLCFAFFVPLITMETVVEVPITDTATMTNFAQFTSENSTAQTIENRSDTTAIATWIIVLVSLYAVGYILFFFRFIRNIYKIFYKILEGIKVRYDKASLVLLRENILPHSFLHYIFLKKEAYDTENIAKELYTHELAHVTQRHTLDIIFIELLQIIFWFNPLLIYYKKAIQLNHEFLADDAVLKSNTQIPAYQYLLLENAQGNQTLRLASNLNFSVTKKRLQMMTKHTTRRRAWFIATLTLPIFIAALFLFSTKVIAQKTTAKTEKIAVNTTTEQNDSKAEYYKNATFVFEDAQGVKTEKKYSDLTATEKARLLPPPNLPIAKSPTKQQLSDWRDQKKFAIWIDGKVTDNSEITNHKIVHFIQSFVYKNARSKRFPQPYQTNLYTKTGFEAMKRKFKPSLGKNAVLYFKEGENQIRMGTRKVSTTEPSSAKNELAKANAMPVNFTNEGKGPNVTEVPFQNASREVVQQTDIRILINKEDTFLLNEDYVIPSLDKLAKALKTELAKITHKKSKNSDHCLRYGSF